MNPIKYFIYLLLLLFSCKQNSTELPRQFASYDDAISQVEQANFKIEEEANTEGKSENNFIESAKYFSNDELHGYLILSFNGKEYIFDDVPINVWNKFKNADDMGNFYNNYIKRKYTLTLQSQSETDTQCNGFTKNGSRCKRTSTKNGYCFQHYKH